jgi:hypothetical protein
MSTIDRNARFERLDFDQIEAGIARGRRLQAKAVASALKSLFSRHQSKIDREHASDLPDCAATA